MDGADMLDRLLADTSKQEKERILKIKRDTYRKDYLRLGRPFGGVRGLFAASGTGDFCGRDDRKLISRERRLPRKLPQQCLSSSLQMMPPFS